MALPFFRKHPDDDSEMSFIEHLEELRWHIVRSLIAIIVGAIVLFINIDWIWDNIIAAPLRSDFFTYVQLCSFSHWAHLGDALCLPPPQNVKMIGITFGAEFITSITIAFVGGFIIAFPYVFWEFWRFIKPALTPKELKSTRGSIMWVSFFFFLGVAFGYFLLAPFTFSFLLNYKLGSIHMIETQPTISDYLENITNIVLGSSLAFQLPIVSYVLTRIGLITPKFLRSYRRYAYVGILVLAAIITPSPDWMSQMIVFIPLAMLYEVSITISKRVHTIEENKMAERD